MDIDFICPCGHDKLFELCCGRIHKDISLALTAEDLMRSRYSAFVVADIQYLIISHAIKTRSSFNPTKTKIWTKSVLWKKLEIINTSQGLVNDTNGVVEFKAYFVENGVLDYIHGKSTFIRDAHNYWNYLDELN